MPQVAVFLACAEVPPSFSPPSGSYDQEPGAGERMPCSTGVGRDDEEHFRVLGVVSLASCKYAAFMWHSWTRW